MSLTYHVLFTLLRLLRAVLYPTKAVGMENIPAGSAVLCMNHASAVDPVLLLLCFPRGEAIRIMAKAELFENPVIGRVFRQFGAFPVNRGGNDIQAIKTALKCLQDGQKLLIFPEGTRVGQAGEADAKGGAVMLSTRTGAPMVPVYCGGRKKLFRRTTIVVGQPFVVELAGRRPTAEELHRTSEDLMGRIYGLKETVL